MTHPVKQSGTYRKARYPKITKALMHLCMTLNVSKKNERLMSLMHKAWEKRVERAGCYSG